MKIVTAENGKKIVKISKSEWETIGKKNGWMKEAYSMDTFIDELIKNPNLRLILQMAFRNDPNIAKSLSSVITSSNMLKNQFSFTKSQETAQIDQNKIQSKVNEIIEKYKAKNSTPQQIQKAINTLSTQIKPEYGFKGFSPEDLKRAGWNSNEELFAFRQSLSNALTQYFQTMQQPQQPQAV